MAYDSHKGDDLSVHTNIGVIKFRRNKQGLYVFNNTYTTENSNIVTTVEENMVVLTSRQIERENLASKYTVM